MKKFLGFMLVAALSVGLVGCGNEEVKDDVYNQDQANDELTEETIVEEVVEGEAEAELVEAEPVA